MSGKFGIVLIMSLFVVGFVGVNVYAGAQSLSGAGVQRQPNTMALAEIKQMQARGTAVPQNVQDFYVSGGGTDADGATIQPIVSLAQEIMDVARITGKPLPQELVDFYNSGGIAVDLNQPYSPSHLVWSKGHTYPMGYPAGTDVSKFTDVVTPVLDEPPGPDRPELWIDVPAVPDRILVLDITFFDKPELWASAGWKFSAGVEMLGNDVTDCSLHHRAGGVANLYRAVCLPDVKMPPIPLLNGGTSINLMRYPTNCYMTGVTCPAASWDNMQGSGGEGVNFWVCKQPSERCGYLFPTSHGIPASPMNVTLSAVPDRYTFINVGEMDAPAKWQALGWGVDQGTDLMPDCVLRPVPVYGGTWSALCGPNVQPPPIPLFNAADRISVARWPLGGQGDREYVQIETSP